VPKKREICKGRHRQPTVKKRLSSVKGNVVTTLLEFRVINKKLLVEEEVELRERGHGLRPDLAAFNIYKERLCVKYNDRRYVGRIVGVQIGVVFNFNMELSVVGIHHAYFLPVDHIDKKDGTCQAVSIVSYAQPSTSNNDLNFLLYLGSMTAMSDQNIEGTYFALKQSMDTGASICVSCNSN
jgi:hypothetical protein